MFHPENPETKQLLYSETRWSNGEALKNVPRKLKSDGLKLIVLKQTDAGCFILELEKVEE